MKSSPAATFLLLLLFLTSACTAEATSEPSSPRTTKLALWHRGISITAADDPSMTLYLWFYEWNVFDAFAAARQSPGPQHIEQKISDDGTSATLTAPGIVLSVRALDDGASMTLVVTNDTDVSWPAAAGIIPCFNPGDPPEVEVKKNLLMIDAEQSRTWFLGESGPEKLIGRDLHFVESKLDAVRAAAPEGMINLFPKWPVSSVNARDGALFRESSDGAWIAGIGWSDTLFVQGHNPWKCMHVCVGVGPLAPAQSRSITGRVWLFRGTRDDALSRRKGQIPATAPTP